MSLILSRKKSNHMLQYERKQSDKKMVQSIIRMRSQLSENFSLQRHKRKPSLNKSKRQMNETLKRQKIAEENKSLIFRIKQVRQKTMKDTMKYMDTTNCQRLTNTRNTFRRKAKQQKNKKVQQQNQMIVKRLINTKSQYSYRNSSQDLTDRNSRSSQRKIMLKRDNSKKSLDLNCLQLSTEKNTTTEEYLDTIEKELQKTQQKFGVMSKTALVNQKHVKRNSLNGKKMNTQEALVGTYNLRKISELLGERSKPKSSSTNNNNNNPQQKPPSYLKKNFKNNTQSVIIQNNELGKIPLKSREIKLEVIKHPGKKRVNTDYDRNLKKQIEAKGAWGNEWLKSYRIIV